MFALDLLAERFPAARPTKIGLANARLGFRRRSQNRLDLRQNVAAGFLGSDTPNQFGFDQRAQQIECALF